MSVPMTKITSSPAKDRWGPPYLLYLGNAKDRLSIKTARGLAFWRPEWCVAQYAGPNCAEKLDLPMMDFKAAKAAGVDTMVLGVANAGGVMGGRHSIGCHRGAAGGLECRFGFASTIIVRCADRVGRTGVRSCVVRCAFLPAFHSGR